MVASLSRDVTEIGARVGVCFFFIGESTCILYYHLLNLYVSRFRSINR